MDSFWRRKGTFCRVPYKCGTPAHRVLLCIKFVEERGVEGEVNTPARMSDARKVKLGMLLDFSSGILDRKTYGSLGRRNNEP